MTQMAGTGRPRKGATLGLWVAGEEEEDAAAMSMTLGVARGTVAIGDTPALVGAPSVGGGGGVADPRRVEAWVPVPVVFVRDGLGEV